jgi:hypothetical protein
MDGNFLGLGLKNLFGVTLFVVIFILTFKIVTLKYENTPEGIRNVAQAI